jgi:RNA polymerase sigma factor (sigma-70 family)
MRQGLLHDLFHFLSRARAAESADVTDGTLLERYLSQRDEVAFEALLARHGPMVLAVCRRVTGDAQAAEDSFQATFLVLARKASSIRNNTSIASWLFGVARRIAAKARAQAVTRRERERRAVHMPADEPLDELTWQELRKVLDEEINHLAEKYRAPVVLCCLEGKSHERAAEELGWHKSSLTSRLDKARELLRVKLMRRGIALSAGVLATALAEKAAAAPIPAFLSISAVKAAALVIRGKTLQAGVLSTQAIALAEEAMKAMVGVKEKLLLCLLALGFAVGVGLLSYSAWPSEAQPPPGMNDTPGPVVEVELVRKDIHGDPLPAAALARMGQNRWLHAMARFVAFTPHGNAVVTVSVDRTVRVWEFPSGKEIRRIALPAPDLDSNNIRAALSKDGRTIATWLPKEESAVYLYDLTTGNRLPDVKGATGVSGLDFSLIDEHLACMTKDGAALIWDWARAKEVRKFVADTLTKAKDPLDRFDLGSRFKPQGSAICYAPDGKAIATLLGKEVKLWNAATGVNIATLLSEETGYPLTMAFSPDGKMLAISVSMRTVFPPKMRGEEKDHDDCIVVVEPATGAKVATLTVPRKLNASGGGPSLVFAMDAKRLYASNYDGDLYEWDIATRKLIREDYFNVSAHHTTAAMGASLSPDGNMLVRTGTGPLLFDLAAKEIKLVNRREAPVAALQFTADGNELLTMSPGFVNAYAVIPSARRWDAVTGKDLGPVDLHGLSHPIAISPDTKILAGNRIEVSKNGHEMPRARVLQSVLIDVASGIESPLPVTVSGFTRIRFSPDGQMLAVGKRDGQMPGVGRKPKDDRNEPAIELYELPAARLRHELAIQSEKPQRGEGYSQTWRTMIFSPDSKKLAAHADPRTLGIWDTTTGQRIGSVPLPRSGSLVYTSSYYPWLDSAAFSPDGRCLVLDMDDGTAVLYELATGQPLRTFGTKVATREIPPLLLVGRPHLIPDESKADSCFAFSSDGKMLARGGCDYLVRLWEVRSGRELATFKGHDGAVTALAFAPDGKAVASASADGTCLIWDVGKLNR